MFVNTTTQGDISKSFTPQKQTTKPKSEVDSD